MISYFLPFFDFVVPFMVMFISNVTLIVNLYRRSKETLENLQENANFKKSLAKDKKAVRFILFMVLAYFVAWSPMMIGIVVMVFCAHFEVLLCICFTLSSFKNLSAFTFRFFATII